MLNSWKILLRTIAVLSIALAGLLVSNSFLNLDRAIADSSTAFPANPLEDSITEDPLLPKLPIDRPLSPQERRVLTEALDALNRQAAAEFDAGNKTEAFNLWNRELRLRRVLGLLVEVKALGRVGEIAWRENETLEVRAITDRLRRIQQQSQAQPLSPILEQVTLQRSLADAFLKLRDRESALTVYQHLLAEARQQKDQAREETALNTIAELHLNWFDYKSAAATYEELLTVIRSRSGISVSQLPESSTSGAAVPLTEADVLAKLAYVYEQDQQLERAIATEQALIQLFQRQQEPAQIPALRLAIAMNYQALNQVDQAIENYQQAYYLAQSLQQFGYAGDALKRLGELHRSQNQLDQALQVYEFLVAVEQQSYNVYGAMNAYDQIAQVHLARQEYPQALAALQKGLTLAKQLSYREDYFVSQIEQIRQKQ